MCAACQLPESLIMWMMHLHIYRKPDMSRDMRFPLMWYVRPAKARTSMRIRTD